jgi:hypothetical protein
MSYAQVIISQGEKKVVWVGKTVLDLNTKHQL